MKKSIHFYRFGRIKFRNPHKINVRKPQTGAMLAHFVNGEIQNVWGMDSMIKLRRWVIPTYILPALRGPARPSIKLREYKVKPKIRRRLGA
jgi:hypothetical protein